MRSLFIIAVAILAANLSAHARGGYTSGGSGGSQGLPSVLAVSATADRDILMASNAVRDANFHGVYWGHDTVALSMTNGSMVHSTSVTNRHTVNSIILDTGNQEDDSYGFTSTGTVLIGNVSLTENINGLSGFYLFGGADLNDNFSGPELLHSVLLGEFVSDYSASWNGPKLYLGHYIDGIFPLVDNFTIGDFTRNGDISFNNVGNTLSLRGAGTLSLYGGNVAGIKAYSASSTVFSGTGPLRLEPTNEVYIRALSGTGKVFLYGEDGVKIGANGGITINATGTSTFANDGAQTTIRANSLKIESDYGSSNGIVFRTIDGRLTNITIRDAIEVTDATTLAQLIAATNGCAQTNRENTWLAKQNVGTNLVIDGSPVAAITVPYNTASGSNMVLGAQVLGESTQLFWRSVTPTVLGQYAGNYVTQALNATFDTIAKTATDGEGFSNSVLNVLTGLVTTVAGVYRVSFQASFEVITGGTSIDIMGHFHTNGVETKTGGFHRDASATGGAGSAATEVFMTLPANCLVQMKVADIDGNANSEVVWFHHTLGLELK